MKLLHGVYPALDGGACNYLRLNKVININSIITLIKLFKTKLYIVLILCLIMSSCKSIWFKGTGGNDSEDGYYWEVEADTVNSYGKRYSEKYLISLNIMKGDTVVFNKKIRSDTACVFSD